MIVSPKDISVVEQALLNDNMIGLVLLRDEESDDINGEDLYKVGTVAKIVKKINLPDGGMNIFVSTLKRFKIKKFYFRSASYNCRC